MAGPPAHSRRTGLRANLARAWGQAGARGKVIVSVAAVVVLALVSTGAALLVSSSSAAHKAAGAPTTTATTSPALSTTTTTRAKAHLAATCPLTGTPAPGGKVPQRPALGVKVGNDPASRPQTGLPQADIVYEEMAEGGITRYLAVFQCHVPAVIGPVRSVRWDDWHFLSSYGHPILSFSGGAEHYDIDVANLHWLFDANGSEGEAVSAYYRTSNRVPPWNYYLTAAKLWALDSNHVPPSPQFTYSKAPAVGAVPAAGGTISYFASGSTVSWKWSSRLQEWVRFVGGVRDDDVSGSQLRATNVIIETVPTESGGIAEGSAEYIESITLGSGPAWILRNGKVEAGTWNRAAYGDVVQYRFPDGKTMTLEPGNTWIEVVPNHDYPVSIQH